LIDGARLAELLVGHRLVVQSVQTGDLYRLDEDFFDEL
jgi:restriction system protein